MNSYFQRSKKFNVFIIIVSFLIFAGYVYSVFFYNWNDFNYEFVNSLTLWKRIMIYILLGIITFFSFSNIYTGTYYLFHWTYGVLNIKKYHKSLLEILNKKALDSKNLPCVAFAQTVCNDFNPEQLLISMKQDYKNIKYFILDDSNNKEQIGLIDQFAKKNSFTVVRRPDEHKKTFKTKAGNYAYFYETYKNKIDYILFSDSATIIDSTYVTNCVKLFLNNPNDNNLGIIFCTSVPYASDHLLSLAQLYEEPLIYSYSFSESKYSIPNYMGYCWFIKSDAMKDFDLKYTNNAGEDFAGSLVFTKQNYFILYSTLNLCGKIKISNFQEFRKQKIKWLSTRAVFLRNGLLTNKNCKQKTFVTSTSYMFFYFQIVMACFSFIPTMLCDLGLLLLGYEFSRLLIPMIIGFGTLVVAGIIVVFTQMIISKHWFKYLLINIVNGIMWYSTILFSFIACTYSYIFKKMPKFRVTKKDINEKISFFGTMWKDFLAILVIAGIASIPFFFNELDYLIGFKIENFMNLVLYFGFWAAIIFSPICAIVLSLFNNVKYKENNMYDLTKNTIYSELDK